MSLSGAVDSSLLLSGGPFCYRTKGFFLRFRFRFRFFRWPFETRRANTCWGDKLRASTCWGCLLTLRHFNRNLSRRCKPFRIHTPIPISQWQWVGHNRWIVRRLDLLVFLSQQHKHCAEFHCDMLWPYSMRFVVIAPHIEIR